MEVLLIERCSMLVLPVDRTKEGNFLVKILYKY